MLRPLSLLALVLAGCAPAPPVAPAPPATTSSPLVPPPPPPSEPSIEPDAATAADRDAARAILAAPPPVMETAPRLSPDGKRAIYLSTADGKRALYLKDVATASLARKIPIALPQRFRRPAFAPDGTSVYFTSDDHADEAYALYRAAFDGGGIERVAGAAGVQHDGPWFTNRGDRLFFTTRPMASTSVAVHRRRVGDDPAPELVFQSDTLELVAVRPDGEQILVAEAARRRALHAVDLAGTRAPRRLYPEPGKDLTIHEVAYAPDGATAWVATDDGGDRATLVAIDVKSGRVLRRWVETAFPASKIQELQAGGDRIAFVVDAGLSQELRVLDARTLAPSPSPSPLPIGSEVPGAVHPTMTGGLHLAPDGKRLVVQWSTPASPPRVHVIDTATGGRSPMTDAPPASPIVIESRATSITSYDGLALPTLIHAPGGSGGKKLPVVVMMHGGFPFAATARFDPTIAALIAEGYVVVEPNLRGSGGFGRAFELADDGVKKLEAVRDLGVVARWVASQPWADADRLAITGRSAGGYYTLLGLQHDPEIWRCGVAIVPVYDVADTIRNTEGKLRDFWEKKEMVPLTEPMILAAISPSTYVSRIRAPLFVFAGARDARATIGQNEMLVRDLRRRGAPLEFMLVDQGHSTEEPTSRAELQARMLRFLRTHLAPRTR